MNQDQSHTPEPNALAPHTPEQMIASCKPRRGLGELLRSVAGATAGWRPNRRGSFLVLVVGTLALLAVMALIYSSIGTHDKQMTSAGAKRDRMDDLPQQVADYITKLISDDTVSTYYESKLQVPGGAAVPLLRKTSDYPSTSWAASSTIIVPNAATGAIPFNPTGSISGFITTPDLSLVQASGMPKSWAPTSPWLSVTEATFLNFSGTDWTDPSARLNPPYPGDRPYLNNRDLAHISNIAPDGRFVNLRNLRGNFAAESGDGVDALGKPRMSFGLSLFDHNGHPILQTDFNTPSGGAYVPAKFDSRQRWMFRAARATTGVMPSDYGYEPNQYASPDGSGMYTARVQELKDTRFLTDILHTDGKYRYFVSTRIIDASSLVNVNTAADMHAAPTAYSPAGSSPTDIDLARLLSLYDSYATNIPAGSPLRGGYDGIFQPAATNVPSFYGGTAPPNGVFPPTDTRPGYDRVRAEIAGRYAYTSLRLALGGGTNPPAFYRGMGNVPDLSLSARFSADYNVPLRSWDTAGAAPSNPYLGFDDPYLRTEFSTNRALAFSDTVVTAAPATAPKATFTGGYGINDLAELITWRSANDPTFTSPLEMAIDGRDDTNLGTYPDSTRFGPLRSNRGLDVEHDQRYTFTAGNIATGAGGAYDRTMLHFATDIRQRLTTISGGRDFRQTPVVANTAVAPAVIGGVNPDQLSAAELRIDPRPILSDIKAVDAALATNPLSAALQKRKGQDIKLLFNGYADALLPTSGMGKAWNGDPKRATEFYGRKGPELAAHVAAHMTMNLIDMYDVGGVPSVQTLLLSRSAAIPFVNGHDVDAYPSWSRVATTWKNNGLELDDFRLGDIPSGDALDTPAVNIYGIEAQPFLTQVGTFTVYADAEFGVAGADDDAHSGSQEITIKGDLNYTTNPDLMYQVVAFQLTNPFGVDIQLGSQPAQFKNYDVADTNYPPLDREANFYYIKFGDRTYKLAQLQEAMYSTPAGSGPGISNPRYDALGDVYIQPPSPNKMIHMDNITIPAGKTIVCYALSDVPHAILLNHLSHISANPGDVNNAAAYFNRPNPLTTLPRTEQATELKIAIEHQLGLGDPKIAGVFWIPEMDITPAGQGKVILPNKTNLFPATAPTDASLWRAMRYGNEVPQAPLTVPPVYWDGRPAVPIVPAPTAPPHNDFTNDQLVDRMHMPTSGAAIVDIRSKLADGENRVLGTGSGTNPPSADEQFLYTITTHASVRRKADAVPPPLGAIPSYCLEPKFTPNWNFFESDGLGARSTIASGAFTSTTPFQGGGTSVAQWLARLKGTPIGGNYAMIKAPADITGPAPALIGKTNPNGDPAGPFDYKTLYPEININDAEFQVDVPVPPATAAGTRVSTLRAADMLLPLGIGPEEMPFDKANQPVVDMDLRWTTLSEALALAMGYQANPPTPAAARDATYSYYVAPGNTAANKMPLDRGNLRLDDSAPFNDANANGVFDAGDQRLGLEIPLALNVLDIFTVYPVDNRNAANFSVLGQTLTTPSHGKININTAATQTVRSSFSMLSPPPPTDDIGANPWWWWANDAGGVRAPLNGYPFDAANPALPFAADISASVISWRDKIAVPLRPASQFVSPAPTSTLVSEASFADLGVNPDAPDAQLNGRGQTANVASPPAGAGVAFSGIHERPGFGSIAELGIVRTRDGGDTSSPAWPINMDWLGNDKLPVPLPTGAPANPPPVPGNSGRIGLDSVLYADPAGGAGKIPDRIPNSYKEQLEVLNSVIGNVSTRSDYFIVWFQIQGYQKSDVENLGDNDPMIPSINRRFVMVVDRSKVTKRGDKADVLLFKEVPVDTH